MKEARVLGNVAILIHPPQYPCLPLDTYSSLAIVSRTNPSLIAAVEFFNKLYIVLVAVRAIVK